MTSAAPLNLHDLNLDEALDALAGGVPLARVHGEPFVMTGPGRAALQFYAARRHLWLTGAQNMGMPEVEELLAWMDRAHPPPVRPAAEVSSTRRALDLVAVEIHHWGGLHSHCLDDGGVPGPLRLNVEDGLTVVRGRNGAGKTALANAIRWVLTGQVARAQGAPRSEPARSAPRFARESATDAGFALPVITPVPTAAELSILDGGSLLETRVALTFRQESGGDLVVERRVTREGRTRFSTATSPAEGPALALGVSSRAIEVSTLLLARLPHLDLDKRNTLGETVAALTGLQPLEALGRRSIRTATYLRKQATAEFKEKQSRFAVSLREEMERLRQLATDHPALDLPAVPSDPVDGGTVDACASELSSLRRGLEEAREDHARVLMELAGVDAIRLTGAQLDDLRERVEAARGVLKEQLKSLPSSVLMREIGSIPDNDDAAARATCQDILRTAANLANEKLSEEAAKRRQLYALVMRWHEGAHPGSPAPADCPVCATSLAEVDDDPSLRVPVRAALNEAVSAGVEATMSAAAWARDTEQRLLSMLPASLQALAGRPLPASPHAAYRKALCSELLSGSTFSEALQPIRTRANERWTSIEAHLPPFEAPRSPPPPSGLHGATGPLFAKLARLELILALRAWRVRHGEEAREAVLGMVGPSSSHPVEGRTIPEELDALRKSLVALSPIAAGLDVVDRADRALEGWRMQEARVEAAEACADATSEFGGLVQLVQDQVGDLMETLNERTSYWLDQAYGHPTDNGPTLSRFERGAGATLHPVAGYGGIEGPADGITNSSAQRAYLWAFSIALWEQLRATGSSLSLLILDDPQTLFDAGNSRRLGGALAKLAVCGARPLVVTSDELLCEHVRSFGRSEGVDVRRLELKPRSHGQAVADLRVHVDGMKTRRQRWRAAKDDDDLIRAFLGSVREYLESELRRLLDHDAAGSPKGSTMQSLLNELARLHRAGIAPFSAIAFGQLGGHPDLQPKSPFRDPIDEAHHGAGRQLTTGDARAVDSALDGVLKVVESCHEAASAL